VPPRTELRGIVFPERKIRCVILHDHVLFRQGLGRLLKDETDFEIVGEAGNAAECLRKVFESRPDVVIADAGAFGLSLAEAELLLSRESSHTKVVYLSLWDHASPGFDGRQVARNCAARQTSLEELVEMVRNACGCGEIDDRDMPSARHPQRATEALFEQKRALTAREREVLKLLAEGRTVRSAAAILGLSTKTVDAHKFNLMRKLGIHNKAEMVMWAIQQRVVKIPASF